MTKTYAATIAGLVTMVLLLAATYTPAGLLFTAFGFGINWFFEAYAPGLSVGIREFIVVGLLLILAVISFRMHLRLIKKRIAADQPYKLQDLVFFYFMQLFLIYPIVFFVITPNMDGVEDPFFPTLFYLFVTQFIGAPIIPLIGLWVDMTRKRLKADQSPKGNS